MNTNPTTSNNIDTNIENNQLTNTVGQYFEQIKSLKQEKKDKTAPLYAQISVIEKSIDSQLYELDEELEALKEQYSDLAHDLAIQAGQCPRSRWGSYLAPNETSINEEGITLTWIQENPYGCDNYDYFTATWKDLLQYEATKQPMEVIELTLD
jgi:hypothetical protein